MLLVGTGRAFDRPWGLAAWSVVAVATGVAVLRWWGPRSRSDAAPWETDREWARDGEVRSAVRRTLRRSVYAVMLASLFACFIALTGPRRYFPALELSAALGTAIVVGLAVAWFRGGVEVRWGGFPMRTGTRVRIHIAALAGGSSLRRFIAQLRCIESKWIAADLGSSARVVADLRSRTPRPLSSGPDEFVTVEFDVPASAPGTDLSRPGEERYWELVVLGTTAWGKIAETFVVPIYAVEGEPAGGAAPAEEG